MNILYIWDADYPWDVRVEKICAALSANGHSVHIASRNLRKRPVYEMAAGIHIHRTTPWKNDRLNYFFSFPLFFSPVWKRFLDRIIKNNDIRLLIVRDLPLAVAGILVGRKNNAPVILDMAEDYVSMIGDIWRHHKYKGLNLVIRNPFFARIVEGYTFRHVDHVIVVVEDAAKVVVKGGGHLERITVVSNTPALESFRAATAEVSENVDKVRKRYSMIYTGGIQMGRGLQIVVESLPEIVKQIPDFLFVVVGDGYAAANIQTMIREKSLDKYVLWIGWVDHQKIYDYIRASRVGVIPHFVTEHTKTTIPNKIFDYMACGLPVIASNTPPMRRILVEEKCGVTFESGDVGDFVRAVLEVHSSVVPYGNNGTNAVEKKFNWQVDQQRLLEVIGRVGSGR